MNDIDNEGHFVYKEGMSIPADYFNWRSHQPNNMHNEDCVHLLNDGTMNDITCDSRMYFVCKCPACWYQGRPHHN